MKTFLLSLLLVTLTTSFSFGQFPVMSTPSDRPAVAIPGTATDNSPKGNGRIAGIVLDSVTNQPVEFATVALLNPQTNKPVDGTTADAKGQFMLTKVAVGTFKIQISFIGYRARTLPPITVERGSDLNVGVIKLASDVRQLNEVQVVGQTALIEEKVDRLVYNADKDLTAKGGDATDIMRKVPMLSVDLDGNVSLRGNSNVTVLINNKPSTIVASSVADALKQIPADQIKTVEVITSPSAKYDAEGSAGIINIVTKKNTLQGLTLSADVGAGNRGANLNLNGAYRTGKMGFTLGGFGRTEYNVRGAFENIQQTLDLTGAPRSITEQSATTLNERLFGNYQLGWDYDINANSSLAASVRFGARNGNVFQNNLLTRTFRLQPQAPAPITDLRNVDTKDINNNIDANLTYTRTFKPQQEFSILALYSRNDRTNNFVADILNPLDGQTLLSRQKNINNSLNQESTIQMDYQTPLTFGKSGASGLLEVGGKGIFRQVTSAFQYLLATGAGEERNDPNRAANSLDYDQNIAAAYSSLTLSTKSKYTIKTGLRYEYTFINARFANEGSGSLADIPAYGTLVPSINLSKNLAGGKSVKLAYNRRIQRPGIRFLNPNLNAANPLNTSQGDPTLLPEFTNNFELALSGSVKSVYLNTTFFARLTDGEISEVRDVQAGQNGGPDTIRTTFQNIGSQNAYGVNFFTNTTLFSKLQIGGGIDAYYATLTNNVSNPLYAASNSGLVVMGRLFSTLTLKNGWAMQAFGGMRGRQVQLQGYQGSFGFYSLGVKKDFNEKRGSIGFAADNFFNYPFTVRSEIKSPVLAQSSVNSFYNAGFRINFSYRIGKMSFDAPAKRKKSINNDDEKGGDGGGDQQQQQPAAGGGGRRG